VRTTGMHKYIMYYAALLLKSNGEFSEVKSASEYCQKLMDRFRCMPKICGILYEHVGPRGYA